MIKVSQHLARVGLAARLVLFLLLLSFSQRAQGIPLKQGPRILVPPVIGVQRSVSLKSHYRLVHALQQKFGQRVVDDTLVIERQKRLRVWPRELNSPPGVARLAQALQAERAIIISATPGGVSVAIYVDVNKAPTRVISLRKINAAKIRKKDARRIANQVARKAQLLLSAEPFPHLTAIPRAKAKTDKAATTVAAKDPANAGADAGTEATAQDWSSIDIVVPSEKPTLSASDEILAEEQREAALRQSHQAGSNNPRLVFLTVGAAVAGRERSLQGSQAVSVLPVQSGLWPAWTVAASLRPLRFFSSLRDTRIADLRLQLRYQRASYSGRYQGQEIGIDDDDMTVRLSYGRRLWAHAMAPSLGLGLGYGWQRAEYQSDLPLVSSRFVFTELHARADQPLWQDKVVLQGLFGLRQTLGDGLTMHPGPAWAAELGVQAYLMPWIVARMALRTAHYQALRDSRLQLDQQDNSLLIEIGGCY